MDNFPRLETTVEQEICQALFSLVEQVASDHLAEFLALTVIFCPWFPYFAKHGPWDLLWSSIRSHRVEKSTIQARTQILQCGGKCAKFYPLTLCTGLPEPRKSLGHIVLFAV